MTKEERNNIILSELGKMYEGSRIDDIDTRFYNVVNEIGTQEDKDNRGLYMHEGLSILGLVYFNRDEGTAGANEMFKKMFLVFLEHRENFRKCASDEERIEYAVNLNLFDN